LLAAKAAPTVACGSFGMTFTGCSRTEGVPYGLSLFGMLTHLLAAFLIQAIPDLKFGGEIPHVWVIPTNAITTENCAGALVDVRQRVDEIIWG
jgi:hypothetical protein